MVGRLPAVFFFGKEFIVKDKPVKEGNKIISNFSLEATMLSVVRSLLQSLIIQSDDNSIPGNILAKVLSADGENALLQTGDRRFHARLAVQVKVGEMLLLKPEETREGVLYCRVLQRMPVSEVRASEPETNILSALLYPRAERDTPYFLTVKTDHENKPEYSKNIKSWQFTLRTLNLGIVVLQVRKSENLYTAGLLLESNNAVENLSVIMPRLQELMEEEASKFIWQKPRLLTPAELRNATEAGASLNLKM